MEAWSKKEVYSPYDIAKLCDADLREVLRWLADGRLQSFEIAGRHRRVSHRELEKFFIENRIPADSDGSEAKYRVLVIEDDADLLEIVGELLRDEPRVEVRIEDNGFNAGLQIASWHPDLILLDFVMPGISGFEICKKIRENNQTRDIPVLALTSISSYENRKAVMDSGVYDFLGKPFHSEMLLKKVRILLGLETLRPAGRTSQKSR